ncbi:MAG: TrmH family RNA methyltransferase [Candidatus Buchananbacteria bacterium]|nr:TrmH family RNA methyltransferase [Candidatus Buchananbacteria bacterium]
MRKKNKDLYVICDNIRSLYNVGSIFRTSDALGVKKIYLIGITGTPLQAGLQKVSLGAENSVAWEHKKRIGSILSQLKKKGVKIVSLELAAGQSLDIKKFKPQFPLAVIVGNEVDGVSKNLLKKSDAIVHIPMQGQKESLNVAVAYGIASYLFLNK